MNIAVLYQGLLSSIVGVCKKKLIVNLLFFCLIGLSSISNTLRPSPRVAIQQHSSPSNVSA